MQKASYCIRIQMQQLLELISTVSQLVAGDNASISMFSVFSCKRVDTTNSNVQFRLSDHYCFFPPLLVDRMSQSV